MEFEKIEEEKKQEIVNILEAHNLPNIVVMDVMDKIFDLQLLTIKQVKHIMRENR